MLRNEGLEEELSENILYKITIDRMAKHIVYGNINIIIVCYMTIVFSKKFVIQLLLVVNYVMSTFWFY